MHYTQDDLRGFTPDQLAGLYRMVEIELQEVIETRDTIRGFILGENIDLPGYRRKTISKNYYKWHSRMDLALLLDRDDIPDDAMGLIRGVVESGETHFIDILEKIEDDDDENQ